MARIERKVPEDKRLYTEFEFYVAVKNILGDEDFELLRDRNLENVAYWCMTIARKYFIDDIKGSYFQSDLDVVRYAATNLSNTGRHGLREE